MRKALIIVILFLFSVACLGQDSGTLKFLGIPIDGSEAQFAAKLKSKGFVYDSYYESYKGQFNGKDVDVYIHTNHDLVDRVYVAFPKNSEEGIRVEFNRLLSQFNDTGKYMDLSMNQEIPSEEDISKEITVNNKRYQASFSYFDPDRDPIGFVDGLLDKLSDFYTKEQLDYLKEYTKKIKDASEDQREALEAEFKTKIQEFGLSQNDNEEFDEEKALLFLATFLDGMKSLADGEVWFMIHEQYGKYYIGLYYDNLHNQAHGEDL